MEKKVLVFLRKNDPPKMAIVYFFASLKFFFISTGKTYDTPIRVTVSFWELSRLCACRSVNKASGGDSFPGQPYEPVKPENLLSLLFSLVLSWGSLY